MQCNLIYRFVDFHKNNFYLSNLFFLKKQILKLERRLSVYSVHCVSMRGGVQFLESMLKDDMCVCCKLSVRGWRRLCSGAFCPSSLVNPWALDTLRNPRSKK